MALNRKIIIYISIFALIAIGINMYLLINFPLPSFKMILIWSCMSILASSFQIKRPNKMVTFSTGYAVAVGAIIVGGPLTAVIAQSLGYLFAIKNNGENYECLLNTPLYKIIINLSQRIVAVGIMGLLYQSLGGSPGTILFFQAILIHILGMLINIFIVAGFWAVMDYGSLFEVIMASLDGTFIINVIQGLYGMIIALVYMNNKIASFFLFGATLYIIGFIFKQETKITDNCMITMQILNRLVEAKDSYTFGHASRVKEFSVKLAESLGYKQQDVERIRRAALLHDIGKIGIDDSILNKPGRLTDEEYLEVKRHPILGAEIIAKAPFLKDTIEIILYHHERYDGKGYPNGLRGDEIPEEASIIAIADAYDAMTSDRPYRKALGKEVALREIKELAGKQFHPEFAMAFWELMCSANSSLSNLDIANDF